MKIFVFSLDDGKYFDFGNFSRSDKNSTYGIQVSIGILPELVLLKVLSFEKIRKLSSRNPKVKNLEELEKIGKIGKSKMGKLKISNFQNLEKERIGK